jgi:hypothetical protein
LVHRLIYFPGHTSPLLDTPEWRQDAFSFCQLTTGQTCSLLVFNAADAMSTKISTYKYSLVNGSCQNAITASSSVW